MVAQRAKLAVRDWLQLYTMVLIIFGAILVIYQRVTKVETKVDMLIQLYRPPSGYAVKGKTDNADSNRNGRAASAVATRPGQ